MKKQCTQIMGAKFHQAQPVASGNGECPAPHYWNNVAVGQNAKQSGRKVVSNQKASISDRKKELSGQRWDSQARRALQETWQDFTTHSAGPRQTKPHNFIEELGPVEQKEPGRHRHRYGKRNLS